MTVYIAKKELRNVFQLCLVTERAGLNILYGAVAIYYESLGHYMDVICTWASNPV